MSDVPDYYLRGEVIKLIQEITLIKDIEKLGELGKISEINPQVIDATEYKTVVDLIHLIKKIDEIVSIGSIGSLGTLDKINVIRSVGDIGTSSSRLEYLRNPSFELGDLTGWLATPGVSIVESPAYQGKYNARLEPDSRISQTLPGISTCRLAVTCFARAEVSGDSLIMGIYTAGRTLPSVSFTLTDTWAPFYWLPDDPYPASYIFFESPLGNSGAIHLDNLSVSDRLTAQNTAHDSVAAGVGAPGLTVQIYNPYMHLAQFLAHLTGAGEVYVEASPDGANWGTLWSRSFTAEAWYCDWDFCAMPYFRVRVPTADIGKEIWIRAVQL